MKVLLKGCVHCGGDVVRAMVDHDTLGFTCIQCGRGKEVSLRPLVDIQLAAVRSLEPSPRVRKVA